MKERTKTVIAFALLAILMLTGFLLVRSDRPADIFPNENTTVNLYGEAHGYREYYDLELRQWKEYYAQGCRNLFVELPYYSAEFLNLWMQADSDELLDTFFAEIRGTQGGNDLYYAFFREIKDKYPETVFYGTDVGHQYDTTGARYLEYLENNGLKDSENYALAQECIRQGKEYRIEDTDGDGISPLREGYMISNFIDAYTRCGGGKIMGIYGSYHTDLRYPDVMAARLRTHYGDALSSVALSNLAIRTEPYSFGFCISGLVILLMLFVPKLLWGRKPEAPIRKEKRFLRTLGCIGQVGIAACLLLFTDFDPCIKHLAGGVYFNMRIFFWVLALVAMILYVCHWVSGRGKCASASFAGFPVARATLPTIAMVLLGIYSGNGAMLAFAALYGIGQIGMCHKYATAAECPGMVG